MKRAVLTIIFGFYCAFVFSQAEFTFSRVFQTSKKSVPLSILNNHADYFHVLRYNKIAHDFIIERRSKPTAEILAFTPLHLDTINASWFDYEKLDYLFFEHDFKTYFIFKRELNDVQEVYLKTIDTNGKSQGFKELLKLEKEGKVIESRIDWNLVNNTKLLLVTKQVFANGVTKKSVQLFDLKTGSVIWTKKIPHEVTADEISDSFTVNENNDLFYIHYKIKSYSYLKKDNVSIKIINEFGDITVFKSYSEAKDIVKHITSLTNIEVVYNALLVPLKNDIIFYAYVVETIKDKEKSLKIWSERFNEKLEAIVYSEKQQLPDSVLQQLEYYDGSDFKEPVYKNFRLTKYFLDGNRMTVVSERKDENYYKELMFCGINTESGVLENTVLVPRKNFYFEDRTRFKKAGECMITAKNNQLTVFVAEHPSNFKTLPGNFKFSKFSRQNGLSGNIVAYEFIPGIKAQKKLVYSNKNFNLVPVIYASSFDKDDVFYFNAGKTEKFGMLKTQ